QAGGNTDGQRDAESLDFAGAHENEDDGRDQRGDVRIENGGEGARVTSGDGAAQGFALADFFPQPFVDQYVGIDRHTDGQHDAGDAGQGEGGPDIAHHAQE